MGPSIYGFCETRQNMELIHQQNFIPVQSRVMSKYMQDLSSKTLTLIRLSNEMNNASID